MALTAAASPKSLPQSSTGRFDVSKVLGGWPILDGFVLHSFPHQTVGASSSPEELAFRFWSFGGKDGVGRTIPLAGLHDPSCHEDFDAFTVVVTVISSRIPAVAGRRFLDQPGGYQLL